MVVFLKAPGFYAAVEQADDPSLRGVPVIVGGDPRKRGTVTAASSEAVAAGVRPGMDAAEALALCPGAHVRATRLKRYREVAAQMRELVRGATDRIEELGLDGTFLQLAREADLPRQVAELCVAIQARLGVRCVAGIGPTRFAAFLASQEPGAAGILQVRPHEVQDFLDRFPVTELWGLGPATASRLEELDVKTIGELRRLSPEELRPIAGRNAQSFLDLACARPDEPLRPKPRAKSLSQERTLPSPSADLRALGDELADLARQLETILAREHRAARTVTLGLGYVDGTQVSRTQTLERPAVAQGAIAAAALALLGRTQAGVRQVRRVRLQLANLAPLEDEAQPEQLRLL
jgi:DNA polymerase-4